MNNLSGNVAHRPYRNSELAKFEHVGPPVRLATGWLPGTRSSQASTRLFCLPHAAAGASSFRDWQGHLPDHVAVCAVQPPGRESRFREQPYDRVEPMVSGLLAAMLPYLDRPFALYGHSVGALVAFELARALRAGGHPAPMHLFVSGRLPPRTPITWPPLHTLESDELMRAMHDIGGTPASVLRNPHMRELLLPLIRADLAVNETYRYHPEARLGIPLTVYHGIDDPLVTAAQARTWQDETTGPFRLKFIPGNHFFVVTSRRALVSDLSEQLA